MICFLSIQAFYNNICFLDGILSWIVRTFTSFVNKSFNLNLILYEINPL